MAIIQGNFPYRVPNHVRNHGDLYGSVFGKIIVSADTTLVVDTNDFKFYNLLLNDSADADTALDIPCFILPSGTMIEDVGIENWAVHTESASYVLGDSVDSDGWVSTIAFVATDTDALGRIRWIGQNYITRYFLSVSTADGSDVALLSTTIAPPYLRDGGRIVYSDSAYSVATVVGLDSDDFPRGNEYAINIHQKGAVDVLGGLSIYVKYNFAPLQIREVSTTVGLSTGD